MEPDAHSTPPIPGRPGRRPRQLPGRVRAVLNECLKLYRQGWFPMSDPDTGAVEWVQPRSRTLIPIEPDRLRITRSLRAKVRKGVFTVTTDQAFGEVIRACAEPRPGRDSTWLSPEIIGLFEMFYDAGLAHSVEAWMNQDNRYTLVGGLYGLSLGRVFAGESMFSRPELGGTDASKVCLIHLARHLHRRGFVALDAQLSNSHLEQFGAFEVPSDEYATLLDRHSGTELEWSPFESSPSRRSGGSDPPRL